MISTTDRMYYIDPLQPPYLTGTRALVFREQYPRGWNSPLGRIVDVTNRHMDDGNLWWRTSEGNYVDAAPVSPPELASHGPVMGILSDEVFIIGESYGTVGVGTESPRLQIRSAVRSDNKRIPAGDGEDVSTYTVKQWLVAAPWAKDLMPAAGDDATTVALKVATAKQRFETRLAEISILREGYVRSWFEDVPELKDHGYEHLPEGIWALYVEARVMVSTGKTVPVTELPESSRTQIELIAKNSLGKITIGDEAVTRVEVPAEFVVRTGITDPTTHTEVAKSTILSAASTQLGSYNLELGSYTSHPVLRSAV